MASVKTLTRSRTVADLRKLDAIEPGEQRARALEIEALSATGDLLGVIEEQRERKQITKTELAKRLEMQRTAVSRLLDEDEANPTVRTLVRFLWAVGLHADITIRDRGKNEPHVMRVHSEL